MLTYYIISETGSREINEDSVRVFQEDGYFCAALADGLGGHGYGNLASALVTANVARVARKSREASEFYIRKSFEDSQELLLKEQKIQKKEFAMKTTLVVFMADQEQLLWGHVGDSRLYYFEEGRIKERTLDHSVPQALAMAGEIKESEIRSHPDRSRLLRAMGIEWIRPAYKISEEKCRTDKQAILICSDGFWEWIEEAQMEECLSRAETVEEWVKAMQNIILKKADTEHMDNYSAIAVWL